VKWSSFIHSSSDFASASSSSGTGGSDALAHRGPVVDRGLDVAEHALELARELIEERLLGLVDLDVNQGLDRAVRRPRQQLDQAALLVAQDLDHRVHERMNRGSLAREGHRDRVDEERHVIGDDLDDAVRRLPPVVLEVRRVGMHLGRAVGALLEEVPVRERGAVEVELDDVLGRGVLVVGADEPLHLLGLRPVQPLADVRDRLLDERRLHFLGLDRHPVPLAISLLQV
jgi:hypothetical protein